MNEVVGESLNEQLDYKQIEAIEILCDGGAYSISAVSWPSVHCLLNLSTNLTGEKAYLDCQQTAATQPIIQFCSSITQYWVKGFLYCFKKLRLMHEAKAHPVLFFYFLLFFFFFLGFCQTHNSASV